MKHFESTKKVNSIINKNKRKISYCIFLLIIFSFSYPVPLAAQCKSLQSTVVLSLDGFRWDYPSKVSTPAFGQIAKNGVKANSLIPSFPTKTFPNHYTLATGLLPDHHGLVNNSFYDPIANKYYSIGNAEARSDTSFYGGEPIWVTAENQGVITASFFWVGSDVAIKGTHPDYYKTYNRKIPFAERIDTVIKWLSLPQDKRPQLIMAYYEEPDAVGHDHGPDGKETLEMVHELDSIIGDFYSRIKKLPNGDCVNLIILSDHGMGPTSSDRSINLREYIPESWPVKVVGGNPNYSLYAEASWVDSAYNALQNVEHIRTWKSTEIPEHLSYGKHPRTGNIIVVADSAWSVTDKKTEKYASGGAHGYDFRNTDMHAIFYAIGPSFKQGYHQPSFQNTNIYPLLAFILGINPAQNDGNLNQVIGMLKIK
jgi:alkaline phosphatase D